MKNLLVVFTTNNPVSSNIIPWVNALIKLKKFKVGILFINSQNNNIGKYSTENIIDKFHPIPFYDKTILLKLNPLKRIQYLIKISESIKSFSPDIIHIHGLYNTYITIPLILKPVKKAKIIFNIWGNDFNTIYNEKLKQKLLMNYFFRKSSLIWVNWYEMEEKLNVKFPNLHKKIKTILWGIESELLIRSNYNTQNYLKEKYNLTDDEYIILYAKGYAKSNNQNSLIDTFRLVDKSLKFKLILHLGNSITSEKKLELEKKIKKYNLDKNVIISNDYLCEEEIKGLFDISNLSLCIPSKDQLSRTLFESIISNCSLIVSDIKSYQYLKTKLDFNLEMIDINNQDFFAKKIEYHIKTNPNPQWENEIQFIRNNYIFENRIETFEKVYSDLIIE